MTDRSVEKSIAVTRPFVNLRKGYRLRNQEIGKKSIIYLKKSDFVL